MTDSLKNRDFEIFKNIFDSIPSRIAVIDDTSKIILINHAWAQFIKSSINSGMDVCKSCNKKFQKGENFFDTVPGRLDSCSQVNGSLKKAIKEILGRKRSFFEIEFSCFRTGEKKYFRTHLSHLNGHPDKILIQHEDITDAKLREEESTNLNIFMQNVLDSLPHPFYVIDIKDYSIKISNNIAQNKGVNSHRKCYEVTHKCTKPCSGHGHKCPVSMIIETKKSVKVEHLHYDENNNEKYVEIHAHPIFNKNGEIVQIIEYSFDITKRKLAENQLKHKSDEILQKNRELEDFTSIVSHDLKQPLTSILGYIDLVKLEYGHLLDEHAIEYLTNTHNVVLRMNTLINSLLNYARLPKDSIQFSKIDCSKILNVVCKSLELEIKAKKATISYRDLPEIYCNPELLTQVFQNLIGNAIKFNDKGSVKIIISAERKNNLWEFSIKDNGIGIKKEFLGKVFDAFYRLHSDSRFSGHGVGLSICKKIIDLHKGRIWVESEYKKGTTFMFTIPCKHKP